jgi:hypothetical protein
MIPLEFAGLEPFRPVVPWYIVDEKTGKIRHAGVETPGDDPDDFDIPVLTLDLKEWNLPIPQHNARCVALASMVATALNLHLELVRQDDVIAQLPPFLQAPLRQFVSSVLSSPQICPPPAGDTLRKWKPPL